MRSFKKSAIANIDQKLKEGKLIEIATSRALKKASKLGRKEIKATKVVDKEKRILFYNKRHVLIFYQFIWGSQAQY
jgi:hypothetical protein